MRFIDLTGQKFGRLTVIKRIENGKYRCTRWLCKCDCGNETEVIGSHIRRGLIVSCGCYGKEKGVKHNQSRMKLYKVFHCMKSRCYNVNDNEYKNYGARGIKIHKEWLENYITFHNWAMANGYKEGLTIDRINVNGNYEPSNCRWTTTKEQNYNRRVNHYVEINGETKCLKQWADEFHISYHSVMSRLKRGWTDIEAITKPIHKGTKK